MGIWRFLLGGIFLFSFCSFKLGDRILEAEPGDYIVTEQDRNYSILLLKEREKNHILFEEITVPAHMIQRSEINWKQWLSKGAQNHTSWIQYEIDAGSLELLEAYSFSRKGWLYMGESDHFLSKLLSLPLSNIPFEERKKIGPAPQEGVDRRKFGALLFFRTGKKFKLCLRLGRLFGLKIPLCFLPVKSPFTFLRKNSLPSPLGLKQITVILATRLK